MPSAIPSPYRDVPTLTGRIRRRKRSERERLADGELPTSNVYFTQFEQTDHQERGIIERVVERGVLLDEIYEICELDKENKPWSKARALRALIGLRKATLAVVVAIRSWRVSVGYRPFLHRGENYLLTVRDDMDVLQDIDPVKHFGFFLGTRNPFVLPLKSLHPPRESKNKRAHKKQMSAAEEDLAREFATVTQVERETFLVAHEYLAEEEAKNTRKKRGSRERKWGYEKWSSGGAWIPPPKPPPRRATRRTMMTTWNKRQNGEGAAEMLAEKFKAARASAGGAASGTPGARKTRSRTPPSAKSQTERALEVMEGRDGSLGDVVLRKVVFEHHVNSIRRHSIMPGPNHPGSATPTPEESPAVTDRKGFPRRARSPPGPPPPMPGGRGGGPPPMPGRGPPPMPGARSRSRS